MNEISVFFTGLVVLMSGSMLHVEPPENIFAAVAVEDNAKPEVPAISTYGVVLPVHDAVLELVTPDAVAVAGRNQQRLFMATDQQGNETGLAIGLSGDRVQFGSWDDGKSRCAPFFSKDSEGAVTDESFEDVPQLSRILPASELADGTHPVDGDYSTIRREVVSSWLDIHGGTFSARVRPAHVERDFLPSRHKQRLATQAVLKFEVPDDTPACVMITPFGAGRPDVVIKLPDHGVKIKFRNAARAAARATDTFRGVTYDFELFYQLLRRRPCPPPIPHFDADLQAKLEQQEHTGHGDGTEPDPPEGAVCGPMKMR
ncbi:MAG TPA: hypothetical protein VEO54_01805 [Thermoanaerobaculia bacterium]|nr:hypothetical protein [Thermoanaerobaculia bacterium]